MNGSIGRDFVYEPRFETEAAAIDIEDALRGLLQVDDAGSPMVGCCFCGKPAGFREALQVIAQPSASVEAGEDESQSWFAHRDCFEAAITPEHRVFRWDD